MTAPSTRISVRKDSPLCGDVIDLDVDVTGGRVDGAAHHARACSMTRASARILAEVVPGRTINDARDLAGRVDRWTQRVDPMPLGFDAVAPVLLMPSRRSCVLLPWRALLDALDRAERSLPPFSPRH